MKSFYLLVSILTPILSYLLYFKTKNKIFYNELIESYETKLLNLKKLTFSGKNAEAYFSKDEKHLIFHSHDGDSLCNQKYIMNIESSAVGMVSTGEGVTTCSYFLYPECKKAVYVSTHLAYKECPPKPDYSEGHVWELYLGYDIFLKDLDGKSVIQLTDSPGYDSEATVAFDGSKSVCTSMVSEDLEMWTMDADGSNKQQITNNGSTNFDLYSLNIDGSDLERITFFDRFNEFPIFSPSEKYLVFASNRNQKRRGGTNLFLAEWNYQ